MDRPLEDVIAERQVRKGLRSILLAISLVMILTMVLL